VTSEEKGPFLLIYERFYVVVIVTAVALVAAYVLTGRMDPVYRSQAKSYMPTQSDTISLSTEEGNLPTGPKLPTSSTEIQDSLLGMLKSVELRTLVATRVDGRNSEWLKKHTSFEIDKFNFIVITALDPDPRVARQVAEEFLRAFRDKLDSTTKERVSLNLEMLVDAVTTTETKVQELEDERLAFLQENGTIDFATEIQQLHLDNASYRNALLSAQNGLDGLLSERAAIEAALESREEFMQGGYTEIKNPRIEQLKGVLSQANLELSTLLLEYRDKHPLVLEKKTEIAGIETELAGEEETVESTRSFTTDELRRSLEGQLNDSLVREQSSRVQIVHYQQLVDRTEDRLKELVLLQAKLETMDADIRTRRGTLADQRSRRDELSLYMDRRPSFLITAEAPAEPAVAFYPILWINLLVAGVVGFAVSIVIVVLSAQVSRYREKALW
jgi:uncharacterized protein involved in exopolysaccharide biosynthesis